MAFDFKKEYKEFYMPKDKPVIISVPKMNYIAVRGKGNPNDENGEYKSAIGLLYGIAFTIKMSKKGDHQIDGYFDYVVPPLEGFCMHLGSYDDEPATVETMHAYIEKEGYALDISDKRLHHEIYLSDARKVAQEKLKTVIRHPIRKKDN